MIPNNGCLFSHIELNGKRYKRIKSGDAGDYAYNDGRDNICHDCNVGVGQYHHFGCDLERCPICREQLISCDCFTDKDIALVG